MLRNSFYISSVLGLTYPISSLCGEGLMRAIKYPCGFNPRTTEILWGFMLHSKPLCSILEIPLYTHLLPTWIDLSVELTV